MPEAVRLVIWDLDDTFWVGTLAEGGIKAYVRENHDIVIELANRGILSSVCSKNDENAVMDVLRGEGIADYFVFPSVSWGPKAVRIASIIEATQLRSATVMFIDDNHLNRAEAANLIPDLQVEDETFISQMLNDVRLKGKSDRKLTRLAHYKLLEERKRDEARTEGNNEEFLRGCDVRVQIEYDVERYIDRAVELINRTNQLNFTKVRLSEDLVQARAELREQLHDTTRQSGLIRVIDKYGDYGFVGLYMVRNGVIDQQNGRLSQRLEHFCFSCRTLGMLVEAWVYEHLRRPEINIVGDVLTDVKTIYPIDWIRLDSAGGQPVGLEQKVFPEIRVHGGCEANSIAHYLTAYAGRVDVTGNFHAGVAFCRVNGSTLLLSACDRAGSAMKVEAESLGIPYNMLVMDYFGKAPAGTAFVLGAQLDVDGSYRYRHKQHGWDILIEPSGLNNLDLVSASEEQIVSGVSRLNIQNQEETSRIIGAALHVHDNYERVAFSHENDLRLAMEEIFSRIPPGSKLALITNHTRIRISETEVKDAPWNSIYNAAIKAIAAPHSFVCVVSFQDHIQSEDEILIGGNHYDRMVFFRMAQAIIKKLEETPSKTIRQNQNIKYEAKMDETTERTAALKLLEALLSDDEGRKSFVEAVYSAFLEKHGSTKRAYNIDQLGQLAAALESHHYVSHHMVGVRRFSNRIALMQFACKEMITIDGPVLEFGVWSGSSINRIAAFLPSSKIYGFDSFEGLPEAWFGKTGGIGQFSRNGELPQVKENVELVPGWFDRVLGNFVDTHDFDQIALLHVDCDLYSSTQTVFSFLQKKIGPGTIIVFDEYLNYPTWQRHEYAAFQEFVAYRQIKYEYIGLVPMDSQVAVRILAT